MGQLLGLISSTGPFNGWEFAAAVAVATLTFVVAPVITFYLSRISKENKTTHRTNSGKLDKLLERIEVFDEATRIRFRLLADNDPTPMFEADSHGECLWVNRAWIHTTGVSLEDALGRGWVTAVHPDDRAWVYREWQKSVRLKAPFGPFEYRYGNKLVRAKAVPVPTSSDYEYLGSSRVLIGEMSGT